MATSTYIPIATTTLTASAASVTFGSIPQDYRDLVLVVNGTLSGSADNTCGIEMNNDDFKYSYVEMAANPNPFSGSLAQGVTATFRPHYVSANNQIQQIYQIFDYSTTDKHKTILFTGSAPTTTGTSTKNVDVAAGRYGNTLAVSVLKWATTNNHVLSSGGTLSLYGIEA